MGYQFFLPMVLRWRALRAEAPLLKTKKLSSMKDVCITKHYFLKARFKKFSKNVAYRNSILKF